MKCAALSEYGGAGDLPPIRYVGGAGAGARGRAAASGLTRHLIQGRALRLNYPLSELKSRKAWRRRTAGCAWLVQKLSTKEVRFYGETTFLFDE